jgi:hypothetical protein
LGCSGVSEGDVAVVGVGSSCTGKVFALVVRNGENQDASLLLLLLLLLPSDEEVLDGVGDGSGPGIEARLLKRPILRETVMSTITAVES